MGALSSHLSAIDFTMFCAFIHRARMVVAPFLYRPALELSCPILVSNKNTYNANTLLTHINVLIFTLVYFFNALMIYSIDKNF